jgi:hypothetical protein
MQLDRTRVAIRERGILDICDLALQVMRNLSPRLLGAFFVGIAPIAVLNYLMLRGLIEPEYTSTYVRYIWNMTLLVFIEAPLATAAATVFLGDAMFLEPPTMRQVLRTLWQFKWRLFVCQLLLRGVLPAWLFAATLSRDEPMPGDFLLPLMVVYLLIVRAVRPFINEIILLERNPLKARDPRAITIGRRASKLHGPSGGELLGRFLACLPLAAVLTTALVMAFWWVQGIFLGDWKWGFALIHVATPAAMWIVAAYMAVVRYLSYLDLRIRREGWAVELLLRAEAARLTRQMSLYGERGTPVR